jgi:hypothetical protein
MSSKPEARPLRLPPANFSALKIPRTRQPARGWFRIHQSRYDAAHFSLSTQHRFSHPDCPCPFLYLGADAGTCLFERFGDTLYDGKMVIPQTLWDTHSISLVEVPEIHVCDVMHARTLSAMMADLSALMHVELRIPQEWGLAIQKHPVAFEGIRFRSRFNGHICLALFQRDGIEKQLREKHLKSLSANNEAVDWLDEHGVSLY